MKKQLAVWLLCVAVFVPSASSAGWFGGSYEDCILKEMKGVTSDVAARSVRLACRKKFAEETPGTSQPKTKELPSSVIQNIEVKILESSRSEPGVIGLIVRNGDKKWRIVSLTARITDKQTKQIRDYALSGPFNGYTSLPPNWLRGEREDLGMLDILQPLQKAVFVLEPLSVPENWSLTIIDGHGHN